MINSKNVFYLGLILILLSSNNLFSQSDVLEILETKIKQECKNCDQDDLNLYLAERCSKVDPLINKLAASLEEAIEKKFEKDKDTVFKNKMTSLLTHTVKDLIVTRNNIIREYSNLNKDEPVNEYPIYLLHLYWSDRITDMLHYYIKRVEGN